MSFYKLADKASDWTGSSWAFAVAFGTILVWAITGPLFNFSSTWQLVINTGTTIVTFLMVFLIQNTQNRNTLALHTKLDELLIRNTATRSELAGLEEQSQNHIRDVKDALEDECGD